MLETLQTCCADVDASRERLTLTFLVYKMISHYQTNLKKKSKYWQVARVITLPDQWDRMIDEELAKLESAGAMLKEACGKLVNPGPKLKFEIDSQTISPAYYLECLDTLKNNEPAKLQLLNCLLIHSQILTALQKGEVTCERIPSANEDKNLEQNVVRKLERCRELIQSKNL